MPVLSSQLVVPRSSDDALDLGTFPLIQGLVDLRKRLCRRNDSYLGKLKSSSKMFWVNALMMCRADVAFVFRRGFPGCWEWREHC